MKIEFTQSAFADLDHLLKYYQEQGRPETGRKLANEIFKKTERLLKHPDSGRIVPEFGVSVLREVIFPPFRIVYRREQNKVVVIRVWRSERLLKID
jgi:plasmid stabilization system protein ParE